MNSMLFNDSKTTYNLWKRLKMARNVCKIGANILLRKESTLLRERQYKSSIESLNTLFFCRNNSSKEMPASPVKLSTRPLLFEKMSENGFRPTRGSKFAAGYDLYSAYDSVVPARGKQMVKTDIRVAVPTGCYGRIAPRSGLAWKHSIDVGAGVVDSDYRGNVCVILFNFSDEDFKVSKGDRIAQLICEQIADTELVETNLDSTERQDNGFGSTGISMKDTTNGSKISTSVN